MAIITDPELIHALNTHGLWHGTTETAEGEALDIDWSIYDRWPNLWLEALDGLYVSGDEDKSRFYAAELAEKIGPSVLPMVYKVVLSPGIEIALDEDAFGWALFVHTSNPFMLGSWQVRMAMRAAGIEEQFMQVVHSELREDFDQMHQLESELRREGYSEQVIKEETYLEDPDFAWYKELVEQWTLKWVEPVLYGWLRLTKENPAVAADALPDLRLLNTEFELFE